MADGTKIEWTDATWNPITGCAIVSPGCTNCYAMKLAGSRLKNHPSRKGLTKDTKAGPVWTGEIRFNRKWLDQPLRWTKPRMIFVCAHGDLFAEGVNELWIDNVFAVMALAPQHTFQVLTKRPERMRDYIRGMEQRRDFIAGYGALIWGGDRPDLVYETAHEALARPLPNVWLGVSVEDQKRADERIPILLDTPAAVRWISAEPLLGQVDFYKTSAAMPSGRLHPWRNGPILQGIHWLVAGGESGPGARPMHPDWARELRDQCAAAGVPFLFKQWGAFSPKRITLTEFWNPATARIGELIANAGGKLEQYPDDTGNVIAMRHVGKAAAGRLLDGVEHNGFPEIRR
ncbi:hypothetical protein AC244_15935 [Ensifer adhaerens]|uniref:Protein gp37 n=1 Tax=Ensifer adhaerens TaxID=106592 RepID=A0A0L8BT03_ENSAD|nr:phage Gp37/Gp68 family protein [Ensifer adhaerens]KOF17861.1 hypothetical protein AC244_15935 [Ensifer adhaerens]